MFIVKRFSILIKRTHGVLKENQLCLLVSYHEDPTTSVIRNTT